MNWEWVGPVTGVTALLVSASTFVTNRIDRRRDRASAAAADRRQSLAGFSNAVASASMLLYTLAHTSVRQLQRAEELRPALDNLMAAFTPLARDPGVGPAALRVTEAMTDWSSAVADHKRELVPWRRSNRRLSRDEAETAFYEAVTAWHDAAR